MIIILKYFQVWCSISTPKTVELQILEDPHSPAR